MKLDVKAISFGDIAEALKLDLVYESKSFKTAEVINIVASDLMSDVLLVEYEADLLVTSLATDQVLRTANIMDMSGVIIVNGKEVTDKMKVLAKECGINLFVANLTKYESCCLLYELQKVK